MPETISREGVELFGLLRDLGEHVRRHEGDSELDQLSEEIGENYTYGLAICFNPKGDFVEVRLTEGQDGIRYKFGSPRGNDYTLVSKTSATTENVVPRLNRNAAKILEWADAEGETIDLVRRCHETAEQSESQIVDAVLDRYPEDASTDKRVFAYWALLDEGGIQPFCEMETIRDFLASAVLDSYAERSSANVRMQEQEGVCSVCGTANVEVYGNFSDIACYNIDKQGFITGGFSYGQTTRNFPICRSCILAVRGGTEYAEEHLDFYMAGLNYWLLPDTTDEEVYKVLLERIEDRNRQSLGGAAESLTAAEEDILGYIKDTLEKEGAASRTTLNFFFYESSNAAWRIAGEMRRVLPSRVNELYNAKDALEAEEDLTLSASEAENGYHFNLPKLQPFCGSFGSQNDRKLIRYLEAIFQENPIPYRTLMGDIVRGILDAQKQALGDGGPGRARYRVRDAWAILRFLDRVDSLSWPNEGDEMTIDFDEHNSYTRYLEDHKRFFDAPEKAAAFLTGCYVGQVLYAQYQENTDRDTQPFAKKFAGQKTDRRRLQYLYNEAKQKFTQYERSYLVRDLEPVFAQAWAETGGDWTLSDEETTFAFNLGWTMSRKLATDEAAPKMETTT